MAEVLVVIPGVSKEELGRFGDNSPFGHIVGNIDGGALTKIWLWYLKMFQFGNGESSPCVVTHVCDVNFCRVISPQFRTLIRHLSLSRVR